MQKYHSRSEVPEEYKWDLTEYFQNEEEFNKSFEETKELIKSLKDYSGCTKDAKRLQEFLEKEIDAIAKWENLYVYSFLLDDQELGISSSIERRGKAEDLNTELCMNISFFNPELLKLKEKEYQELFVQNPNLEMYRFELDKVYRDKKYILSEEEENIVTNLTNSMNHFSRMSSNLINNEHKYGKITLSNGTREMITSTNYRRLSKDPVRVIRKRVRSNFYREIDNYGTTHATLLDSYVKMQNASAKIHHFASSWAEHIHGLNMPDKVFKTLVSTTEENLKTLHKFYDTKLKALDLDKLYTYDLNLDMARTNKTYTIEEAQDIVRNALKPLGKEYVARYNKIIDNRFIDYCQYPGKRNGGYSASTLTRNSRILMSFNEDLESISTIAHEVGHNINNQLMMANNPPIYSDNTPIVAEVASLTNEFLLSDYIAKNGGTKDEKLSGLSNIMEVIVSNLFGAVREGKMEQDMYKYSLSGGTLTREYLDTLTRKSLKKYYGNKVSLDKYARCTWALRNHYYMNFYLYSYALCVSVASYVSSKILEGDEDMLKNYLNFLTVGSDKWPMEAFQILGIDLTDKEVYIGAIKHFDKIIDEFINISNS